MDDWRSFLSSVSDAIRYEQENKGDAEGINRVWQNTMNRIKEDSCDSCKIQEDK